MPSILRKSTNLSLKNKETLKCVVTGLPAKYRDPQSGLYFANLEAFRTIKSGNINKRKRKMEGAAKPRIEVGWKITNKKAQGEREVAFSIYIKEVSIENVKANLPLFKLKWLPSCSYFLFSPPRCTPHRNFGSRCRYSFISK